MRIILQCISIVSLLEGSGRGNRSLPIYLFLCMDKLSHLMVDKVSNGKWTLIRVGRSGPNISHLMFADDVLLFAEASLDQISIINSCL